uniref:Potassium calcium-activated channel subfamily M regulatory beta subunit 3 n=1 Tax=Sander lucioperca TaxID=283035 RepID=A0A8C9XD74_SANLU
MSVNYHVATPHSRLLETPTINTRDELTNHSPCGLRRHDAKLQIFGGARRRVGSLGLGTTTFSLFSSNWENEASCVLLQAVTLEKWVDCRGVSTVPCLRVTVNLTDSNERAFLHFDEESVLLASECFYIPKCQMERTELQDEVLKVKNSLDTQLGSTSSCFTDRARHPRDVILGRKYTFKKALFALLWPCLMLGGGALLVGLVKLTQCLAHLCPETFLRIQCATGTYI